MRMLAAALLLLLAACSPEEQDYVAKPAKVYKMEPAHFSTQDEYVLPYRQWLPTHKKAQKNPKALIIALHGFNDYSNAFEGPGQFFRQHDIAVFAYDQRGFGQTANRGIWAGEANLVGDLRQFVEVLHKQYPQSPIYLLGESMGGAVVISAVADPSFPKVDGIILSAPALWGSEAMNFVFRGTLWMAAHTMPYTQFSGSDLKILATNNIPMLRKMSMDPSIIKKTRVDAVYGVVQLMGSAYDKIPFVNTPVLLLYGAKDQVIPRGPIQTALTRFGNEVDYAYYPAGYHMLLRDLQAEEVMQDVLSWIEDPSEELPSGFGHVHVPKEPVSLKAPEAAPLKK